MTETRVQASGRPISNGIHFDAESGKLRWFGYRVRGAPERGILVLKSWPAQAWLKQGVDAKWRGCRPDLRLYRDRVPDSIRKGPMRVEKPWVYRGLVERGNNYQAWLDSIPRPALRAARLPQGGSFQVLSMIARCGQPAMDLMASNPALGLALANLHRFRNPRPKWSMRSVRGLLPRRQAAISGYLGFGERPIHARMLRRLDRPAISVAGLFSLRWAMAHREELATRLAHVPRLNVGLVYLASFREFDLLPRVSDRFLRELGALSSVRDQRRVVGQLIDSCRMRGALGEPVRQYDGALQVHRDHEWLLPGMQGFSVDATALEFPPPPLPAVEPSIFDETQIIPLESPASLLEEARAMKHCVFGYASGVSRGFCYLYAMLTPFRCTIEIQPGTGGWRVAQVRGPGNQAVEGDCMRTVKHWVRSWSHEVRSASDGVPF